MDTPESPTQSPQSPEEEKGLSDSELLRSPDDDEAGGVLSDSELLQDEDNGGLIEEEDDEEEEYEDRGGRLDLEDEVVPDFVSDPEDEEPVEGLEDETIVFMDGDEDDPKGRRLGEEEDRVLDTPQSPDLEPDQSKERAESEEDGGDEGYGDYREDASAERDEDKTRAEEEEEEELQRAEERRAVLVREMKEDSASVSRELDEHELDYDEEVPEEQLPAQDEEEDEEDAKAEGGEEDEEASEEKNNKKREKKPILPPSPADNESKRPESSKGTERLRRDSFRDRKKDEDDGEIDEGEIDVSDRSSIAYVF